MSPSSAAMDDMTMFARSDTSSSRSRRIIVQNYGEAVFSQTSMTSLLSREQPAEARFWMRTWPSVACESCYHPDVCRYEAEGLLL